MIIRNTTRTGAIILSKGQTIGEIAKEIGEKPEIVWRSIRQHCLGAARKGLKPNIQPEKWLWQTDGNVEAIRVIRHKDSSVQTTAKGELTAGRSALEAMHDADVAVAVGK